MATPPCSAALFLIIVFCSGVYFPYWPLFLLLFESIMQQTSELKDAINVDGQFLATVFPFLLKYRNNAILGAERRG